MKTSNGPSKGLAFFIIFIFSFSIIGIVAYKDYITYKSIDVSIKKDIVEYGEANYNLKDIVDKVNGEIISIKKSIDTNVVGKQELVVEVLKDSVTKDVPIKLEVVDTLPPEIILKKDKLSFMEGEEINLLNNIEVVDSIDGALQYKDVLDNSWETNYFKVEVDGNISEVGTHKVLVTAIDKYGNVSTKDFLVEVNRKEPVLDIGPIYSNLVPNNNSAALVNVAYSLIGSPYLAGGNTPSGFDCSGFVQYVYAQTGTMVSRSSSTQVYDGLAINYEEAKPGDILSWGYGNVVTHSALYVGDGLMIHATNPRQGVILSNVSSWTSGSNTKILSVRRII